jgi:2-oxoglutarate ferredoxin oxidoreductase subunit beta
MYQYLDLNALPYSFCPGCGHGAVVDALDAALSELQLDPHQVVIVTDIGCAGLADRYFATNAFHGLHGRAVTYATGMKLANPELTVIALMGDGGCGIGGHHLLNAARRDIGVTVVVFNNLNYGMTGGQHSATTPPGGVTATTWTGNLERPMDICGTVLVNGAGFAARTTSFDQDLPRLIAQAIRHPGFALVEAWELCAAYYAPRNRFNRRLLEEAMAGLGFERGLLKDVPGREYSLAYREAAAESRGQPPAPLDEIEARYASSLAVRLDCLLAGAAGMKIGTAAAALCRGAMLSGLWATQRDNYPVTVRTGYSLSEVTLSPRPMRFGGSASPDWAIILFEQGLKVTRPSLAKLGEDATAFVRSDLLPVETGASVVPLDLHQAGARKGWALAALAEIVRHTGIYPVEAFKEAAAMDGRYAGENLKAIEMGLGRVII